MSLIDEIRGARYEEDWEFMARHYDSHYDNPVIRNYLNNVFEQDSWIPTQWLGKEEYSWIVSNLLSRDLSNLRHSPHLRSIHNLLGLFPTSLIESSLRLDNSPNYLSIKGCVDTSVCLEFGRGLSYVIIDSVQISNDSVQIYFISEDRNYHFMVAFDHIRSKEVNIFARWIREELAKELLEQLEYVHNIWFKGHMSCL